jgi:hypothetical protein
VLAWVGGEEIGVRSIAAWLDPAFRDWNIEEYLSGVRAPVLLIQGEDDEYGTLRQINATEAGCRGLATGPSGFVLVPIEGGEPRTCAGLESEDWPIRWSADGASIYVARHRRMTTRVFRVKLASGRPTLLWELGARDPVGADSPDVGVTADGKAYACTFGRSLGDLYVVVTCWSPLARDSGPGSRASA